ncbi:MAG: hypothetical protein MJ094_00080 [Saccharofermentans sp.]|nr:hypothetical protein [Saccharofermentans sp.]
MLHIDDKAIKYFADYARDFWDPSNAAKLQTFIDDPDNTLPSSTKLVVVEGGMSEKRRELAYALKPKLDGLHTVIVVISGEPTLFDTNGLVGIEKNIVETAETLVSLSGDPDYIILHGEFHDEEYTPLKNLIEVIFRKHCYVKSTSDSIETDAGNIFNQVMESFR